VTSDNGTSGRWRAEAGIYPITRPFTWFRPGCPNGPRSDLSSGTGKSLNCGNCTVAGCGSGSRGRLELRVCRPWCGTKGTTRRGQVLTWNRPSISEIVNSLPL
jgi:hypothetical protein